jgi:LPXTG-motif cell wall-anchored protein
MTAFGVRKDFVLTRSIHRSFRSIARALGAAVLLATITAGPAAAQSATSLDRALTSWNRAGAALPEVPRASVANTDRCQSQERAGSGPEESAVTAGGWRLTSNWPSVRASDVTVVVGTAGYDGMCRPIGYQGFVFAGGRYAGSLAPEPMTSRADGALVTTADGVAVRVTDTAIEARFVRYASNDPLCCPSRGQTRVSYRIARGSEGPLLVPEAIVAEGPAPAAAPTQLPRTGGAPTTLLVALGGSLILAGRALSRHRRRNQSSTWE